MIQDNHDSIQLTHNQILLLPPRAQALAQLTNPDKCAKIEISRTDLDAANKLRQAAVEEKNIEIGRLQVENAHLVNEVESFKHRRTRIFLFGHSGDCLHSTNSRPRNRGPPDKPLRRLSNRLCIGLVWLRRIVKNESLADRYVLACRLYGFPALHAGGRLKPIGASRLPILPWLQVTDVTRDQKKVKPKISHSKKSKAYIYHRCSARSNRIWCKSGG